MLTKLRVVAASLFMALPLLFLMPTTALATIDKGGCTGSATASVSGKVDLATAATWTVVNADVISGGGSAPTEQTVIHVNADVFGVPLPVYSNTGKNKSGNAGPYKVSDYSKYGRVIAVDGSTDSCHGSLLITVKDVNPFTSLLGIIGEVLAGLGALALIGMLFSSGGMGMRILGLIVGLLGGAGLGLLLTQMGVLDPRSLLGLAAPIFVGLLGGFLPGLAKK